MEGEALDPSGSQKGDAKEAFNIGPPFPALQPLPEPLSASSDLIKSFQHSCHALCGKILSLLASGLEIADSDYFADRHDQSKGPSGTIFRMLYYPKSTSSPSSSGSGSKKLDIRAGAHSDYGSITLLFRLPGQAGLELLTPTGAWVPVPVNPAPETLSSPPILVNIGDLLCYWTNGMLKSTVHRVAFSGGEEQQQERYSMAYFCHPLDEVRLEAVESRVVREGGDREELGRQRERLGIKGEEEGVVITAKEHLERRLKVTYGL